METLNEFTKNHYQYYPDMDEIGHWYVLQYESGSPIEDGKGFLDASNYSVACAMLDGVQGADTYNGWIVVEPNSDAQTIGEEIEQSLADYPVLDDSDLSERENDAYYDAWIYFGCADFASGLAAKFGLSDDASDFISDLPEDELKDAYESVLNEFYCVESDGGIYLHISDSVEYTDSIEDLLEPYVKSLLQRVFNLALRTGTPDMFSDDMRAFWGYRTGADYEQLETILEKGGAL